MRTHSLVLIGLMAIGGILVKAQGAPVPSAPAPGSPGTYKSAADLMEVLSKATAAGGMLTSEVSNTDQYRVNIVRRTTTAGAITHPDSTELHYILEGAGTLVTGGSVNRPGGTSAAAATIDNGVSQRVAKGDVVVIPANTAHWYKSLDGPLTYLEVRFVAPKK